jgi:uncharacterized membrane protein
MRIILSWARDRGAAARLTPSRRFAKMGRHDGSPPARRQTLIEDPGLVLAYLAGVVGLVFQVSRVRALAPLFDRLPALVWTYFLPMLSTSVGILPSSSPVYAALARYLLPASLVLMLLSAELRSIARLGRTALVVMLAGCLGIMLGALVGYAVLRPWLPDDAWKAVGALTATWTGGSANLVAVATTLELSPELQGVIIIVDTVVGYSWMGVLIWLAGQQSRVDRFLGADRSEVAGLGARLAERREAARRPMGLSDVTLMVALAIGLTILSLQLGARMPPLGRVLNAFSWAVLIVTTVSLLLSLTRVAARLEEAGASTLGYAGFYLLLASVGAQGDLRKVVSNPQFVLLGLIVIAVHAAVTLLAVRLLRAPVFFFGAASQACLGGYSSAPVVAAIYEPAMAPLGLLLAVLGNLTGTYLGLLTAQVIAP